MDNASLTSVAARRKDIQAEIQQLKKEIKASHTSNSLKRLLQEKIESLEKEKALLVTKNVETAEANHEAVGITAMKQREDAEFLRKPRSKKMSKWQKQELEAEAFRKSLAEDPLHAGRDVCTQERDELLRKCGEEDLGIHEISPDGHCLFNAISHQLSLQDKFLSQLELRRLAASYIRENLDRFLPFYVMQVGSEGRSLIEHCDIIENSAEWGGHLEIQALSEKLRVPIWIYQARCPTLKIGASFSSTPLLLSYTLLCCLYFVTLFNQAFL